MMDEQSPFTNDQFGLPPVEQRESVGSIVDARFKGMGGWLLLFVICLLGLNPLRLLSVLASTFALDPKAWELPGFKAFMLVELAAWIGFVLFGVAAGVLLCLVRRPVAVKTVKAFLVSELLYCVLVAPALPFVVGFPAEVKYAFVFASASTALSGLFWCSIWYAYFDGSRKVRATYKAAPAMEAS